MCVCVCVYMCFIWAQRRAFKLVRAKWEWSGMWSRRKSHEKVGTLNPCPAPFRSVIDSFVATPSWASPFTHPIPSHLHVNRAGSTAACLESSPHIPGQVIRATCGQFSQLPPQIVASMRRTFACSRVQIPPAAFPIRLTVRWIDCSRICTDLVPLKRRRQQFQHWEKMGKRKGWRYC